MDYIGIDISCDSELSDILIAELGDLGFDSFLETESGIEAYCPQDIYNETGVIDLFKRYKETFDFKYSHKEIPKINWNEEWEKNYDPIYVGEDIYVRATFHEHKPEYKHEIVIDPKMSFGTGHHSTTSMMLNNQLEIDHHEKTVLDAGTGTGILAIMAAKLGAKLIHANDIDDWCIENSEENIGLNKAQNIKVHLGATPSLPFEKGQFDIVLANINKNVLLEEMSSYSRILKQTGTLVLSGFYEHDLNDIETKAKENGLTLQSYKTKSNWVSPIFKKI